MSTLQGSTILGANWDGSGVNFALYSARASAVELCLFSDDGTQQQCIDLPHCDDGVFHGYLPGCAPGQHYAYRVRGEYDPASGKFFNPNKLLVDPYAKLLSGPVTWSDALFAYDLAAATDDSMPMNGLDSAAFVPKGIVQGNQGHAEFTRPKIPWSETIVYEVNPRGYTMRHPAVAEHDRGRFLGMTNHEVLKYLKALGITAVELMPVHAFVDEDFLSRRGLRNYWGYNSLNFFAPESRLYDVDGIGEFRAMVHAIHDAGLEVVLDVVYNHTAEGGRLGPMLSYKGIDNLSYYRTLPDRPGEYINDAGCGNTINADSPIVQDLVVDSLRYWANDMGVDGFRFDLCPILGRSADGFDKQHALLSRIETDPQLRHVKLIAEPWDIGPGGYQLGNFSENWSEWNDQYRDTIRRFWRGDQDEASKLARRLHGSADIFESRGRTPRASVNFVTSHDGYTLFDLVSYNHRHNEANGESNQDGHRHNYNFNHGAEGLTDDVEINALRRRQRLNMLATLLLSQGTPMLLAGDEFGNSQNGNNNAYAQDNEVGWLDWTGVKSDPEFVDIVRSLTWLRRRSPLIRNDDYRHGQRSNGNGHPDIRWALPNGDDLDAEKWKHDRALQMLLVETDSKAPDQHHTAAVAFLVNAAHSHVDFALPTLDIEGEWQQAFASCDIELTQEGRWRLPDRSSACFLFAAADTRDS